MHPAATKKLRTCSAGLLAGCSAGFPARAPNPSPVLQSCFGWVFDDVPDSAVKFVSIADQAVVVLSLPELTLSSERLVCGFCRKVLPGFDDLRKLLAWEESHHHVNVVGHNAPGEKPVVLSLPEAQGRGHGSGDTMIVECARADAAVEVLFDARVAITGEQFFLLGKQIGILLFGSC